MSHDLVCGIAIGIAAGVALDGLIFDWPFRRRRKR